MPNSSNPSDKQNPGKPQDAEARLRQEIRHELEEREQRMRQEALRHEEETRQEMEERSRTRLKQEEEEKFFQARGYVRHMNRYGHVEWITPEEAQLRKHHRRKEFMQSVFKGSRRSRVRLGKWAVGAMLVLAIVVTGLLVLRAALRPALRSGSLSVQLDLPGESGQGTVSIYVDGELKTRSALMRAVIPDLSEGPHSVVVHREGFQCLPPVERVNIKAKTETAVRFRMTGIPLMGRLGITSNLKSGFDLYVDGIPTPFNPMQPLQLPIGYHVICAVKDGYTATPQFHRVFVTQKDTAVVDFNFQSAAGKTGMLEVTCGGDEPAYVYLDGAFTGVKANGAPLPVTAGLHRVEIPAVATVRQEICTVPGTPDTVDFTPAAADRSQLPVTITARTPGAGIVIDGQWMSCVTPWTTTLAAGRHYLNLFRDGKWSSAQDQVVVVDKDSPGTIRVDF